MGPLSDQSRAYITESDGNSAVPVVPATGLGPEHLETHPDRARTGPVPEIASGRCLHAVSEISSCRACVEACPQTAWLLSEDSLALDTDACDGCGLCRPACPEAAVVQDIEPLIGRKDQRLEVLAACERVADHGRAGIVPCLHAIGLRDLLNWYRQGLRRLHLTRADCDTCSRGRSRRLEDTVTRLNHLLASGGLPVIECDLAPLPEWEAQSRAITRARGGPILSRRGFLSRAAVALTEPADCGADFESAPGEQLPMQDAPLTLPFVPVIDPERCSGCDLCIKLCPHDVLGILQVEDRTHYSVEARRCTGCGLCSDGCDLDAISVNLWSAPGPILIALVDACCRACGVRFHRPSVHESPSDLCQVCETKNHYSALYQVLT